MLQRVAEEVLLRRPVQPVVGLVPFARSRPIQSDLWGTGLLVISIVSRTADPVQLILGDKYRFRTAD